MTPPGPVPLDHEAQFLVFGAARDGPGWFRRLAEIAFRLVGGEEVLGLGLGGRLAGTVPARLSCLAGGWCHTSDDANDRR